MALSPLPRRLLVVAPHPDDETLANGILIQRVLAAGGAVRVLLLTDGDNNPWPQRCLERRWHIGTTGRARWGRRRRDELSRAMAHLGLPATALTALGWPDMGVFARLLQPAAALDELAAVLADFGPDQIALPALHDRHPDHGAAHVLLRLTLARLGRTLPLLSYAIHEDRPAADDEAVAGEPAQQAAKRQALEAYTSQLVLSGARFRALAERPERHALVQSPRATVARRLPWRPVMPGLRPLRLTLASSAGELWQWPWSAAPLRADGQGGWRLDWPALPAGEVAYLRLSSTLPSPWIYERWGWCTV